MLIIAVFFIFCATNLQIHFHAYKKNCIYFSVFSLFFIKKLIFDRALLSSKGKKEPHRYHFTTLTLPIHYHITIYREENG